MSTGLGMSLDDAIHKRRKEGGGERKFSKNGPGKFGGKKLFKKRFGRDREERFHKDRPFRRDREDRPFKRDREDRPFKRDRSPKGSRGAPRRFGSDRNPRFATRFIRRTGAPKTFRDNEEEAPKRFRENRDSRESEGAGHTEGTKIKISNLDFNITHKDIMELFSKLVTVKKKNKIIYDELGRSRGKAFVEFEKPENASNAIKEYNGAVLDGKTITVEYDDERAGRRSGLMRKPISRDNFRRRDDFRREDKFRSEGDWRRDKRDDRRDRDDDRPFRRRGGFRGGFRRNRY